MGSQMYKKKVHPRKLQETNLAQRHELETSKKKNRGYGSFRYESSSASLGKSPLMIMSFLALWLLSVLFYAPRLWQIVAQSHNIIELVLLSIYCAMIIAFWLLAAYYVAVAIFSLLPNRYYPCSKLSEDDEGVWPEVALLYPTCNDFQLEAATSCLNQDYPNFHMFLLDDSTKEKFRAEVDTFHAKSREKTTIVRRSTRQGFKAGNLNNALRDAAANYRYFAVVDADERLPTDFLSRAMPHMRDSDLAFVQANHAPNPEQDSAFARDIAPTIVSFWDVHCRPRNRYGFVLYLGHGAVVRRNAWEAVGGFPEVVLEDLAFSAVLRTKGLQGRFIENLLCYEDFPSTYLAFKRQHERYIIGTTQVMHKYLMPLLRSPHLSWIEKIDFCLWCSPLYVPALFLLFVGVASFGVGGLIGNWGSPTISFFGHDVVLPAMRTLDDRFNPLWSRDLQLFSVICSLSPAFGCILLGIKGKLRAIRLLFFSTVPYLSLMIVSWRGILLYLLFGKTFSPPTGESVLEAKTTSRTIAEKMRERTANGPVTWTVPRKWEICIGVLFLVGSLATFNLALGAASGCLLMGNCIEASGWEMRAVRIASMGCFTLILLQKVINVALLFPSAGLVPMVFSIHF